MLRLKRASTFAERRQRRLKAKLAFQLKTKAIAQKRFDAGLPATPDQIRPDHIKLPELKTPKFKSNNQISLSKLKLSKLRPTGGPLLPGETPADRTEIEVSDKILNDPVFTGVPHYIIRQWIARSRKGQAMEQTITPIKHTQTCEFCKVITHSCDNKETCDEPDQSVCSAELCNLKLELSIYKTNIKHAGWNLPDGSIDLKSMPTKDQWIEKCKALDSFRILMHSPNSLGKLVTEGGIDTTLIKLYLSQNRQGYAALPQEILSEIVEMHHEFYSFCLEILHSQGLKVQIRKSLIEKTNAARANGQPEVKKTKIAPPKAEKEAWMTTPEGKIMLGWMKTHRWTREQAQQHLDKMNAE